MVEPTYNIHRIDGMVDRDVTITVRTSPSNTSSISIPAGKYVTVIVLTNNERQAKDAAIN